MAINPDRQIITYENIALLQSDAPAHSSVSNSGSNLSFLPLVQGIDFSVDINRENVGALGSKTIIDSSNRNAPDVNFNVNTFEDFGNLFSSLISGSGVRDNLNTDKNFYAYIGPERGTDAKKDLYDKNILINEVKYYCFKSLSDARQSWFAAPSSGTIIYEENFDGSSRNIIGGPYANPTAAHIDVQSGKVYYGNNPIHVFGNGANQALVPMSLSGKQFGSFFGREPRHNIFMLGLEDNTTVDLHWERSKIGSGGRGRSGINSTPSGTFTLNAGEQLKHTIEDNLGSNIDIDQAVLTLNANKNIICAVDSNSAVDAQIMAPAEQDVYRRRNHLESNIVGQTPDIFYKPSNVEDSLGAFATDIADGDGSSKAGHIGFSKLSKYFAFAGDGYADGTLDADDWEIVAPYSNTDVEISYWSGDNWYVQHSINLNGSKTSPHRTGFTPVEYPANDLTDGLLYKIEASNPIAFFVDDWNEGDEDVVVGWNDESLPENNRASFGQFLSFGNCFLNNVNISQSINGLMRSTYSFTASNVQAEQTNPHKTSSNDLIYNDVSVPSFDLTGIQNQTLTTSISGVHKYYSSSSNNIIPHYSTNVIISGSGSVGNFLVQSDSIQDFNLSLPIPRKTIYSLGKKYPVKRKALFPSESTFSFSNRVSNFEVDGDRSNLKDFLNSDEDYDLYISGKNDVGDNFNFKIKDAKLSSQNYNSSIQSDVVADLAFTFELNDFINSAVANGGSVTSFTYDSIVFEFLQMSNGKPRYTNSAGDVRIGWGGSYWILSDFRTSHATFTPINPVQSSLPLVPGEDTDYPFLDLNGLIRSEFSNLVFS